MSQSQFWTPITPVRGSKLHAETQHEVAREWLDQEFNGSTRVGLPRDSLLAFLRLVTNPRVFERPEPMLDASNQMRAWLACETAWIPQPTERHPELCQSS